MGSHGVHPIRLPLARVGQSCVWQSCAHSHSQPPASPDPARLNPLVPSPPTHPTRTHVRYLRLPQSGAQHCEQHYVCRAGLLCAGQLPGPGAQPGGRPGGVCGAAGGWLWSLDRGAARYAPGCATRYAPGCATRYAPGCATRLASMLPHATACCSAPCCPYRWLVVWRQQRGAGGRRVPLAPRLVDI